ncbi:hypothetical protein BDN67DRAFT_984305 [Paxillus ammoniavirescens]|nr:hypothetical protein BDN67DRAFT_984305 [Paxillus ammoniavirescens]
MSGVWHIAHGPIFLLVDWWVWGGFPANGPMGLLAVSAFHPRTHWPFVLAVAIKGDYQGAKDKGRTVNGKWQMANGEQRTAKKMENRVEGKTATSEQRMENGKRRTLNSEGKWQTANGKQQMANSKWKTATAIDRQ